MTEKEKMQEKLYQRAVKAVERLVAGGATVTQARNIVAAKFGIGYPNLVDLTMHLSPKAQNTVAE